MLMRVISCAAIVAAICGAAAADEFADLKLQNWHQWRGPQATGVAPQGNPPTEWSETKNIKWKVEIPGQGSASPIVWGDKIFVSTAIKTERTGEAADTAAARSRGLFRQVALTDSLSKDNGSNATSATLLAQNTEQPSGARPGGERGRDRERGGFGRPGGGGRGGGNPFGITPPTNIYQFVVLCIDRKTGNTLWQKTANELVPHEGHHQTASFASASPVTDGKHVWVSFGSFGLYCYDMAGNLVWEKDLGDMQTRMMFGEGSSPALHDGSLVVLWDHEGDDFIATFNARTGDEKWRMPRDEPTTWSTPLVTDEGGVTQVVTSGANRIRSYDFRTGQLLWECGGLGSNPIATPVVIDGVAISMTGHRDPAGIAVPLDARGDVSGSDKIAWQVKETTPYIASPVLYDDLLYFTKSRNAILSIVEAKTGKVVVNQKRLPDQDTLYASPVGAAGRVYFPSREGMTVVIKHGREFEVLAQNQLDETIDASPAIVGREMFIRGDKHLYCIAEE